MNNDLQRWRPVAVFVETFVLWSVGIYLAVFSDYSEALLAFVAITSLLGMIALSKRERIVFKDEKVLVWIYLLSAGIALLIPTLWHYQKWDIIYHRFRTPDLIVQAERPHVVHQVYGYQDRIVLCVNLGSVPNSTSDAVNDLKTSIVAAFAYRQFHQLELAVRCGNFSSDWAFTVPLHKAIVVEEYVTVIEGMLRTARLTVLRIENWDFVLRPIDCESCPKEIRLAPFRKDNSLPPFIQKIVLIASTVLAIGLFFFLSIGFLLFCICRLMAFARTLVERPISVLRSIPAVWVTRQFSRSVFSTLEVLPNVPARDFFDFGDVEGPPIFILRHVLRLTCFISAVLFKLSGVLLYPLVFLATALRLGTRSLESEIALRDKSFFANVAAVVAILVLVYFGWKLRLFFSSHIVPRDTWDVCESFFEGCQINSFNWGELLALANASVLLLCIFLRDRIRAGEMHVSNKRRLAFLWRLSFLLAVSNVLFIVGGSVDFLSPLVQPLASQQAFDLCCVFSEHPNCWNQ